MLMMPCLLMSLRLKRHPPHLVFEITLDKIRLLIEQGLSLEQAITQFLHDTHPT